MLLKASETLLDSFYPFAEGDIEKFCRIDWDSIRQKIILGFVQIVHVDVRERSITADSGLRIYSFLFYGYGTGDGTGTGYSGFSYGLSAGLSYGQRKLLTFPEFRHIIILAKKSESIP